MADRNGQYGLRFGLGKKYIRGQQCVVPLIAVKESIEYCVCDMESRLQQSILSIPLYKSSQHKEIYLFYYVVPDQKKSTWTNKIKDF